MARLHSSLGDRTSYTPDGVAKAQGLPATVYEDPAGTVLANLAAYDPTNVAVPGAAIPGAALTVDAYSSRPAFWDLNDRNVLYITGNGGPLEPIHPDAQPQVTALATRVGTVEATANAAETPAGAQAKANAAQATATATAITAAADYATDAIAGRLETEILLTSAPLAVNASYTSAPYSAYGGPPAESLIPARLVVTSDVSYGLVVQSSADGSTGWATQDTLVPALVGAVWTVDTEVVAAARYIRFVITATAAQTSLTARVVFG